MSGILEQAKADLARATREANALRRQFNAAVERVNTQKRRVQRLEITAIEIAIEAGATQVNLGGRR